MGFDFDNIANKILNNEYKPLGRGSGRKVYDLGNGYVVKVAINKSGIAQNEVEYTIALNSKTNIFAKVISASENFKYAIMEKAEPAQRMRIVWEHFGVRSNRELYQMRAIRDILSKYSLKAADFGRASNWGIIDNTPVIIDYGFTYTVFKRYYFIKRIISMVCLGYFL